MLTPLQILTGLAMSPALAGRFPWFPRLVGGRQAARSLHFLGLMAFVAFTVHHVALVIAHGLASGLAAIVLGNRRRQHQNAPSLWRSRWRSPVRWLPCTCGRLAAHCSSRARCRMRCSESSIQCKPVYCSRWSHDSNIAQRTSRPIRDPTVGRRAFSVYVDLVEQDFAGWTFEVGGLVERPLSLTLDELRRLRSEHQITLHKCIQGWSYTAAWQGVPLGVSSTVAGPVRMRGTSSFAPSTKSGKSPAMASTTASSISGLARAPQTMIAYDMNGQMLPAAFGAPLRLRLETQLGYKMVKWIRSMELIANYDDIGAGYGGWRADRLHYSRLAPI